MNNQVSIVIDLNKRIGCFRQTRVDTLPACANRLAPRVESGNFRAHN